MKRSSHLPLLALTTALALSLGGCMAKTTTASAAPVAENLPQYQQGRQAQEAAHAIHTENRLAALQTVSQPKAGGLVLLRRTEPVQRPPSKEELEATVTRLSNAVVASREGAILEAAARASAEQSQVAAARAAVQSRDLTLSELSQMRAETERQLELLKQQSSYEAQLAELKATQTALQQARLEAERAEARSKEFTIAEVGAQKASANAQLGQLLAEGRAAEARTQSQIETTAAKLAALTATSAERLEANQRVAAVQMAAEQQVTRATLAGESAKLAALTATAAERLEANQRVADVKLASLEKISDLRDQNTRQQLEDLAQLTATNQRLMQAETRRMGNLLADYSTAQVNQLKAETDATLQRVAAVAKLDVSDLRAQTANKLEQMQVGQQAEFQRLAKAANTSIAQRVAVAEKKAEDRRLKPDEVKQIATSTVRESAPQFRALALQTLADSQDYIRATARVAVKDDPETREALQQAARDVITKDNQIVFAIRKVVDKRLARLPMAGPVAPTVPNGRPANTYNGEEISLDGTTLGVAPEAIEPAAGPGGRAAAQADVGGRQIASLTAGGHQPGMMRARQRHDWIDLRKYRVVLHEDGRTLPQMVGDVVARAEPYTGPWEIKWKVSRENKDLLTEKFSLDAETTFEEFVNYLASYMVNERGVKLSFSLFDSERVLVISD